MMCTQFSICLIRLRVIDFFSRYFVTALMGADLSNILKIQRLTDDHVQFLVYQVLRGLKVSVVVRRY